MTDNIMKNICLIWLACLTVLLAVELDPFEGFWKGNEVFPKDEKGNTWRQYCELKTSIVAVEKQVEAHFQHRDYQQVHAMEQKAEGKKLQVSMWKKDNQELIVVLLEQDVDKTILCWGIVDEKMDKETSASPYGVNWMWKDESGKTQNVK
jgi:hypothetical protein